MKRATTNHQNPVANADVTAPTIMMRATNAYTLLRPSTSAIRPNTKAPMNAARIVEPATQLVWVVDRCHCALTRTATVLITKRS